MVIELDSGSSGPGSSPSQGHCVVFLDKTLNSHSTSLHPGVQMGTSKFNAGGTLRWTSIPSRGSSNIPSRLMLQKRLTWISSRLMGHLGSYTDLTYLYLINRETARFNEKLGDSRENGESWVTNSSLQGH